MYRVGVLVVLLGRVDVGVVDAGDVVALLLSREVLVPTAVSCVVFRYFVWPEESCEAGVSVVLSECEESL